MKKIKILDRLELSKAIQKAMDYIQIFGMTFLCLKIEALLEDQLLYIRKTATMPLSLIP